MNDYVGLAQGVLGWAAWKRQGAADARRLSQAAMDSWDQLNFPYPFRWTGALTLLAVQWRTYRFARWSALSSRFSRQGSCGSPMPINASLETGRRRLWAPGLRNDA